MSATNLGFIFAIASSAMFAIRPIFVKLVYIESVDPLTLIAIRMMISLPIYAVILLLLLRDKTLRARLNTKNVLATMMVGCFGYYFASYLDLIGLQYVTAQLGRMVLYVYPTFVVLFGALLFSERITLRTVVSLIITYLGVLIIFGHDLNSFGPEVITGTLYILACAACFAVYLLGSKALIKQIGSRLFTSIALGSASIAILAHYAVAESFTAPSVNSTAFGWIFVIAIFCTVIPSFLTAGAVAKIGADKTGIVAMIGPGFTSLFAVYVLSEDFTIYHMIGITLSIIGVWVLKKET